MNRLLRSGLVALVALNLLFVHLTGAVGAAWLIALAVFTLSAPWTLRYREGRLWCALWNAGVLVTFAALVRDAMTTGPRQLLEDGMTLAAYCQVHLLNVIRDERRADLLFFNSFLIAVVTSFFCQDLSFSVAFAAWVVVFVITLSVAQETRDVAPWTTLRDAAGRAAAVLLGTMLVFAVWPRDFRRPGLVDDSMFMGALDGASQVGFSDKVDLAHSAHVAVSTRVALTATLESGTPLDVPRHWRGATLEAWDGRRWYSLPTNGRTAGIDLEWEATGKGAWTTGTAQPRAVLRVAGADPSARRLFAPLATLTFQVEHEVENVMPTTDGCFVRLPVGEDAPVWRVGIGTAERRAQETDPKRLNRFLHLALNDPRIVPEAITHLLREATRDLPRNADPSEVATRCRDLLATRFGYLAPGRQGAARSLHEFLDGDAPAHCEYFATALALMLRTNGIPCRVATGYLAHEWKPDEKTLVIRDSDAHAWVEVFDPRRGWYALDATPSATTESDGVGALIDAVGAWLSGAWNAVTTFDAERRAALLTWVGALPQRTLRAVVDHPASSALALTVLAAWIALRRRRRRVDRAVFDYRRSLSRLRIARRPDETPRELLARVTHESTLTAIQLARLREVTLAHEQARFAAPTELHTASTMRVRRAAVDRLRSAPETPKC